MKQIIDLKNWTFKIASLNFEKPVTLPHTWNVDDDKTVQLYRGAAEYSSDVELGDMADKLTRLYFGCAYHTCNLYVNGHLAGWHTGSGNTPFEFDVTRFLHAGTNHLRVEVDNLSKAEMLPHELHYDWADDGGLTRNVILTIGAQDDIFGVNIAQHIERIDGELCSGRMDIAIDSSAKAFKVELVDCKTNKTLLSKEIFASNCTQLEFENLRLWSCDNPNLYCVRVSTASDSFTVRTGLRTIEVKGPKVLLNGSEIYLKGCEWMPGSHPDYGMAEPLEHSVKCLSQLKAAGCNFTRFHWQQDTSIFDWCDENGLLVQEEIPYWGQPTEATPMQLAIAKTHADAMVRYHGHHPAIICWGVGNELGGPLPATIDYVDQMYAYFKALDATRLVNYVSNSVGRDENVERDDATLHGDIAMWNEYLGLWQPCDDVEYVIRRTYKKFGDMPSMVTEFGLCEPHFSGGDERRIEILRQRVAIYRTLPNMVGYIWFSLNDYRTHCGEAGEGRLKQRIHGSTDLYGNEKPSYAVLKEVNSK